MNAVARRFLMSLLEVYSGASTSRRLAELERTQWMNPEQLRGLQEERLRALVKHVYRSVPYYQRVFKERGLVPEDIRTVADLQKLPVLTRENVRNNWSALIALDYPRKRMRLGSTGGTTGEPLRYYHPRDSGWDWGAFWRGMHWYGVAFGDRHAYIGGHAFNPGAIERLQTTVGRALVRRILHSAFELTPERLGDFVRQLERFKPVYLVGYPSALYIFSRYVAEQRITDIRPRVAITTAEKLHDHQREAIRRAFGCDVYEYYGSGEVLSLAYECPRHGGLHPTVENVVVETVRDGKNTPPGESGAVTVTDLHNYAMPFIRYRNGDLATLSATGCSCGRGLPLLASVEGRIAETIVTDNGFVASPVVIHIFRLTRAAQFQVIQESRELIRIMIVKGDGYSQKDTNLVMGTMRKYLGEKVRIQLEFVDMIPLSPAGKHRVVISRVPSEF